MDKFDRFIFYICISCTLLLTIVVIYARTSDSLKAQEAKEEQKQEVIYQDRYVIDSGRLSRGSDGLWIVDQEKEKMYLFTVDKNKITLIDSEDMPK